MNSMSQVELEVALSVGLAVGIAVCLEVGFRVGKRYMQRDPESAHEGIGAIEAAVSLCSAFFWRSPMPERLTVWCFDAT